MEKESAGLLVRHVVMNGDDVDALVAQTPEHWLQLVFQHREVTIDNCIVIGARECRPGVYAHFLGCIATTWHLRFAPDNEFEHAVVRLPFAENGFDRWRRN